MLVLDPNRKGLLVAFLITNRNDSIVMDIFITFIHEKCGKLTTKTFMSDMQRTYYNSWSKIIGSPSFFLFCAWHVREAWRKNRNKIKGTDEEKKKYLLHCTSWLMNSILKCLRKSLRNFYQVRMKIFKTLSNILSKIKVQVSIHATE